MCVFVCSQKPSLSINDGRGVIFRVSITPEKRLPGQNRSETKRAWSREAIFFPSDCTGKYALSLVASPFYSPVPRAYLHNPHRCCFFFFYTFFQRKKKKRTVLVLVVVIVGYRARLNFRESISIPFCDFSDVYNIDTFLFPSSLVLNHLKKILQPPYKV